MTTKGRKSSAGKGGNAKPQAQNQLKNAEKAGLCIPLHRDLTVT